VEDANVVCTQLGFIRAVSAPRFSPFGQSSGPIWLDQLGCAGTEGSLCECTANNIGVHDCSHFEDAGAVCQGNTEVTTHIYSKISKPLQDLVLSNQVKCYEGFN